MTAKPLHTLRIGWLIAAIGVITSPTAFSQSFAPARFGDDEKSLGTLIEFPELRGDASVAISCLAVLKSNGKLDQHGCYQVNPGDETFIAAIYAAVKKARLIPASYDGKNVDVVFQYRVQFTQKGEDTGLRFVANPGYAENVEAYGAAHVAAQRVFGPEDWQKACPRQANFTVLVKANVDFEGRASAASVTHANGLEITEKCRQAIIDTVVTSRYVPAHADGEAVTSTFVEPFGN